MAFLRWSLGLVAVAFIAGWLTLVVMADRFRQSFGASANSLGKVLIPPVMSALILLSVVMPGQTRLLHAIAVLVILSILGLSLIARKAPFIASLGVIYLGAWLLFYWLSAWSG